MYQDLASRRVTLGCGGGVRGGNSISLIDHCGVTTAVHDQGVFAIQNEFAAFVGLGGWFSRVGPQSLAQCSWLCWLLWHINDQQEARRAAAKATRRIGCGVDSLTETLLSTSLFLTNSNRIPWLYIHHQLRWKYHTILL